MEDIGAKLEKYDQMLIKMREVQDLEDNSSRPYQLPEFDDDEITLPQEPDSELILKVQADIAHYNEFASAIAERDQLLLQEATESAAEGRLGDIQEEEYGDERGSDEEKKE